MKNLTVAVDDYKYLVVTIVLTFVYCWALQEILERKFRFSSRIRTTSSLDKINKKMTRPLDLYGIYRITPRGSVCFVKSVWASLLFIGMVYLFVKEDCKFFIQHFIKLDSYSINDKLYLHLVATGGTFYLWEVIADKYGKLKWSLLVHHFMTSFAAAYMLLGIFNPFASWYAFAGVGICFPMNFAMGCRMTKSNKYPIFTRNMFVSIYWYYMFCCVINFGGQIYLMVAGALLAQMEIYVIYIMIFVCIAWGYDDYLLLKALKSYTKFDYESLDSLIGEDQQLQEMYIEEENILSKTQKSDHVMSINVSKTTIENQISQQLALTNINNTPIPIESPALTGDRSNSNISNTKSKKYASDARIGKLVTSLIVIIISLLSIIFGGHINIYKSILLLNSALNTLYVLTLLFVITYAKQLHYIKVDTIGIYGYRAFSVPSEIKANVNKCIKSISDISALPGSSTQFLFLIGNCMSYVLVLLAVVIKINEWNQANANVKISRVKWISLYLFLVTDIGMLLVAIWNLEDNKLSTIIHYFGASCVFFLCSISFVFNQNFSLLSIILLIVQIAVAALYLIFIVKTPNEFQDIKKVHRISYLCISFELVTCSISMLICNLFLLCMDGDNVL